MQAFSLKVTRPPAAQLSPTSTHAQVIKGIIDQVEARVRVKWVQPRVLDQDQIRTMQTRFSQWAVMVGETARSLEATAPDLFPEAH